ncbi:TetR/AcrR family transcriptional regulator [Lysinimonas soli]|uniref:TetR/AcrR family transcriptional regulator n=1 Tax=Lysinimonas soli TaxID=1074233 RepID=A0ABW0NJW6_9MICO
MGRPPTAGAVDRRERLLIAGIEAFGATPYDEVRISTIAAQTGVAAGLPFHYFGSKRGYYLEVLRYIGVQLREVLTVPPGLDPGASVRAVLLAHFDWLESHPVALRELLRGPMGADPEARVVFEADRWDGMSQLLTALGVAAPDARTRMMVEGWITMKDDVMMRWIDNPSVPRDEVIEFLVRVLGDIFDGLGEHGAGYPDLSHS